jgi:NAD(P)-dependent dehydrogenase (short-subunit alcohol dehydrogenase family)
MSYFNNANTIITGAGSGMGRQMALQAAKRGARVIAVDYNNITLDETKALAQAQGSAIETFVLDVANAQAIEAFAQQLIPTFNKGRLILINNAGVSIFTGNFEHTPLDEFEWLINVNMWGVIRLTKAFYPYFLEHNNGHIVNLSSVFGLGGMGGNSAYCTSKFAVRGFTETLRMELADTNVGTTSVHPGGVKTNIVRNQVPKGGHTTDEMLSNVVNKFEKNARTTPEHAAQQILDAVEKKKTRLVIGSDGKMLDFVTRLFPQAYSNIVRKKAKKSFGEPFKK